MSLIYSSEIISVVVTEPCFLFPASIAEAAAVIPNRAFLPMELLLLSMGLLFY